MFRFLEYLVMMVAWFSIFLAPVFISGLLALPVWLNITGNLGKAIAVCLALAGIYFGFRLAEFARKKTYLVTFVPRPAAMPEPAEEHVIQNDSK